MLTTLATGLVLVLLFLVVLWVGQRRLIYFPYGRVDSPVSLGLRGTEEFTVTSADGVRLHGWYVPAMDPSAVPAAATPAHRTPPITVIVFAGNAGNMSHRAALAAALAARGIATVLFDYRGYGESEGRPSEAGFARDAAAVADWVRSRRDVDPRRVVYFGESLGSAVALRLAIDRPPLALVLRSPFTSLADVGRAHYPSLPVGLLLRDRYASIDRVTRLTSPLLVITGDEDEVVPVSQSERLYAAAPEPKRLVRIDATGHNDHALLAGRRLVDAVVEFVTTASPVR